MRIRKVTRRSFAWHSQFKSSRVIICVVFLAVQNYYTTVCENIRRSGGGVRKYSSSTGESGTPACTERGRASNYLTIWLSVLRTRLRLLPHTWSCKKKKKKAFRLAPALQQPTNKVTHCHYSTSYCIVL